MRSVETQGMRALIGTCRMIVLVLVSTVSVAVGAEPSSAPALHATFEWRSGEQVKQIELLRHGNRIERRTAGEPIRVWQNEAGGISLTELELNQQQAIEFSPGELRARQIEPRWDQLSQMIDPDLKAALNERSVWRRGKHYRQRFRGHYQQQAVELTWLRDLQLPESAQWKSDQGKSTLRLVSVEITDTPAFTQCDDCVRVDIADLGEGPHVESATSTSAGHSHRHAGS